MKFNSLKTLYSKLFFLIIPFMLLVFNLVSFSKEGFSLSTFIWPLYIFIMLSMYFNTYYLIDKDRIYYKSGFALKGSIQINSIYKINKVKRFNIGYKPALTNTGLLLCYNKYDEIFISPDNSDLFIDMIKCKNPKVELESK